MVSRISPGIFALVFLSSTQSVPQEKPFAENIKKGLEYLLKNQEEEGMWPYNKSFYGETVREAVGSLAALSLKIHLKSDASLEKGVSDSLGKANDYFLNKFKPKGGLIDKPDRRNWDNTFTILYLLRLYKTNKEDAIKNKIDEVIKALVSGQEPKGGWTYHPRKKRTAEDKKDEEKKDEEKKQVDVDQMTFMASAAVISLIEAKGAGFDVPEKAIKKAIEFLESMRDGEKGFKYCLCPQSKAISAPLGSSARSVPCELALYIAGQGTREKLVTMLNNFFDHRGKLEKRRKQGTVDKNGKPSENGNMLMHDGEKNGGIAPYYFFYSHFYVLQAIHLLGKDAKIKIEKGEEKTPEEAIEHLKKAMAEIQYEDGSWLDSARGGRPYATGIALIILAGEKLLAVDPAK